MITSKMKHRIKRELSAEKPTIWVGKDGPTPEIMNEISRQLEKREIVKARILKSAIKNDEARKIASRIAEQTGSTLIEVRGHTLILYKRPKREQKSP